MVQGAPGGQVPASQLCSELYQKCPDARALVQKHDGLKGFVATPVLEGKVKLNAKCEHGKKVRIDVKFTA